jgi:hypothetical protein
MADVAATRIPDKVAIPVLANDLPTLRSPGLLERSAAALATPQRNGLIKDTGEVLARSAVNLAEGTLTKDAEEALSRSVAALRVAQAATHPDGAINDAVDHLTEQLAALCLEHLEGGVNVSMSNRSKEMDVKV